MSCGSRPGMMQAFVQYRLEGDADYRAGSLQEVQLPHSYFGFVRTDHRPSVYGMLDIASLRTISGQKLAIPANAIAIRVFEVNFMLMDEESRTNPFFNIVSYYAPHDPEKYVKRDLDEYWPDTGIQKVEFSFVRLPFPRDKRNNLLPVGPSSFTYHLNNPDIGNRTIWAILKHLGIVTYEEGIKRAQREFDRDREPVMA